MPEYRYELRVVDGSDYNSFADISQWYFTNGCSSSTSPAGHSDKRRFPKGTVVLVRLRKATDQEGYYMEGFAKVTKFSKTGRPVGFGDNLANRILGRWEPPSPSQVIYDERTKEVKEIR